MTVLKNKSSVTHKPCGIRILGVIIIFMLQLLTKLLYKLHDCVGYTVLRRHLVTVYGCFKIKSKHALTNLEGRNLKSKSQKYKRPSQRLKLSTKLNSESLSVKNFSEAKSLLAHMRNIILEIQFVDN